MVTPALPDSTHERTMRRMVTMRVSFLPLLAAVGCSVRGGSGSGARVEAGGELSLLGCRVSHVDGHGLSCKGWSTLVTQARGRREWLTGMDGGHWSVGCRWG